ncbi:hypothetical protein N9H46_00310 [Hellea sp.]|nr:hypothetical protein [Hellea sp.]MDA9047706.1 hypothetical protein [Hellea sp.]
MARDKNGIPFHPTEYDPDYPRIKCKICGQMNSCTHIPMDAEPWYPRLPVLLEGGMVESIGEIQFHPYTLHSLKAISKSKISQGKIVIENFIHAELQDKLTANWPTDMYTIEVNGRLQADIDCNDTYQQLSDLVFNHEYVKMAIADKFGFREEHDCNVWLWEDSNKFTVNDVHVDSDLFGITFGMYLPGDDKVAEFGTQFWKPNEYEQDLETSILRENCKLIDQLPFTNGTTYFIPRTEKAWHSSPIINKDIRRKHVYGFYSVTE